MSNKYYIAILVLVPLLFGAGCKINQDVNVITPTSSVPTDSEQPPPPPDTIEDNGLNLNLSNQHLTSLPSYVLSRTNLKQLNISNNNLTGALPAEIRHLQNLEVLNASNNQMTGVPAEVGQLSKLKILDFSNNQLTGLPHEIGNLKQLLKLILTGNNPSEQDLQIIRQALPNLQVIY